MTISLKFLIEAAEKRGWAVDRIDADRGFAIFQPPDEEPIVVRNSITELSTALAFSIATYKYTAQLFAKRVGFHVADSVAINEDTKPAEELLERYKRVVVKPMDAAHGEAVATNVTTKANLDLAIKQAHAANVKSWSVVVQQYCSGKDYRLIVLEDKVIAAIERVPFSLIGDGVHTIAELVQQQFTELHAREDSQILKMELREEEVFAALAPIKPTDTLEKDKVITAQSVANLSRGGEAIDVTGKVHPTVEAQSVAFAKLVGLGFCAVDVLSSDISQDPEVAGTVFIEANVAPGFRGHYYPKTGESQDIAGQVLDAIIRKRHLQKTENNV